MDLPEVGSAGDKDALLYDYSKHLLSLALLGIGGILSLSDSARGQRIPGPMTAMLIVFFAAAGFCALTCTANILRARQRDQPTPHLAWISSQGAMLFLGVGVGSFLTVWLKVLM